MKHVRRICAVLLAAVVLLAVNLLERRQKQGGKRA